MRGAADRAVLLARRHLLSLAPDSRVHDVQQDPRFQEQGVDLLWQKAGGEIVGVEVKGDRQGTRKGNYFFELISNLEKNTPGCFLYSRADLLIYVFLRGLEIHALPLGVTRAWFLEHAREFPLRHTTTRLGDQHYTTVGALVPVQRVIQDVPGCDLVKAAA